MCGIAGFWRRPGLDGSGLEERAERMSRCMAHRGPDDSGTWADAESGVAFGFRRLSIIDLSPLGHQPMRSASGRFTLVFNGEIYNHPELAAELRARGRTFRGHSDTEIALAAFEEWGIEASVARFIGMFAIAVWDRERRKLSLIRDRLGIKPVFVYQNAEIIAFASELKALMTLPEFSSELDTESVAQYLRHLYVPAPRSIFRNVRKLLPGHILEVGSHGDAAQSRPYWSLDEVARAGRAGRFDGSDTEAVDELETLLRDAVRLRMRADVPVGAFLSGGVDSSTVAALMQEVTPQPVRTFTISFDDPEHDEADEAAAVASYLGTSHTTIPLTGDDALALIPRLPDIFDEPIADPSQLPTYLICAAARREVVVAISGDGGDELFAGYNRYGWGARAIDTAQRIPMGARRVAASGITSFRPEILDRINRGVASMLRRPEERLAGEKLHKVAHLLRASSPSAMYTSLVSAWQTPPVRGASGLDPWLHQAMQRPELSLLERMMLADQRSYLADDLLAKVDRASMAVSLEVRVPILDHRVVELSWRYPDRFKHRDGRGKWVLRQVLERRVPRELIDRPKVGFSVPLATWLRGPLRAWADERLQIGRLSDLPELDAARVHGMWQGFVDGRHNQHLAIWSVLMLQAWRERWLGT